MGKEFTCNAGDTGDAGSIPGSGRSPGEGQGNPLQYSCLESPRDREPWQATVHGVAKSVTQLKWTRTHWSSYHPFSTLDTLLALLTELILVGMNNGILHYSLNFNFPDDWCAYWPFIYLLWWSIISIFWIHAYTCTTNIFSNSGACFFISLMSFGEQRFLIFNFHEVQFINFFSLMVYSFCILKLLAHLKVTKILSNVFYWKFYIFSFYVYIYDPFQVHFCTVLKSQCFSFFL